MQVQVSRMSYTDIIQEALDQAESYNSAGVRANPSIFTNARAALARLEAQAVLDQDQLTRVVAERAALEAERDEWKRRATERREAYRDLLSRKQAAEERARLYAEALSAVDVYVNWDEARIVPTVAIPNQAEALRRLRAVLAALVCPTCGQKDHGQTGEYPCSGCGLPRTWDDTTDGNCPNDCSYACGPESECWRLQAEALNFYADADNYFETYEDETQCPVTCPALLDDGQLARAALAASAPPGQPQERKT